MPKLKKLADRDAQKLFVRFAAPLFRAVKTLSQQKGAQRLAQTLWIALITGPEIEAATFESLEKIGGLDAEDLAVIKERYYREMKPSISNEELLLLKARYKVRKKGKMNAVIISAGVSGLTAGAYLARAGHQVSVYEQFGEISGVIATIRQDGFGWDLGPLMLEGFGPGEPAGDVLSSWAYPPQ